MGSERRSTRLAGKRRVDAPSLAAPSTSSVGAPAAAPTGTLTRDKRRPSVALKPGLHPVLAASPPEEAGYARSPRAAVGVRGLWSLLPEEVSQGFQFASMTLLKHHITQSGVPPCLMDAAAVQDHHQELFCGSTGHAASQLHLVSQLRHHPERRPAAAEGHSQSAGTEAPQAVSARMLAFCKTPSPVAC